MNRKKLKGIGSLVGKAVAVITTAGVANLVSDMILFGGKLKSDDDDETEEKTTTTEETKEDSEETHFCEEDIEIEDGKEDEES